MKKILLLIIVGVFIVSGCTNGDNSTSKDSSLKQDEKSSSNDVKEIETMSLPFKSVNNEQHIKEISQIKSENIIKEQSISIGQIILYTKKDDNENVYGAFKNKVNTYDLGVIGGNSPQNIDELLTIKELKLFDKPLIRIDGVFGANSPIQNYFSIEEGELNPFLRVDTGNVTEIDLDGNGINEIVSSHGTPMTTYIYKWNNGEFVVSNINEALNALSVNLNVNNQFEAWYKDSEKPVKYQYNSGVLELLK